MTLTFEHMDVKTHFNFDTFDTKVKTCRYLGHLEKLAQLSFFIFTIHPVRALRGKIPRVGFLPSLYIGGCVGS
jgi:hypothetical protein